MVHKCAPCSERCIQTRQLFDAQTCQEMCQHFITSHIEYVTWLKNRTHGVQPTGATSDINIIRATDASSTDSRAESTSQMTQIKDSDGETLEKWQLMLFSFVSLVLGSLLTLSVVLCYCCAKRRRKLGASRSGRESPDSNVERISLLEQRTDQETQTDDQLQLPHVFTRQASAPCYEDISQALESPHTSQYRPQPVAPAPHTGTDVHDFKTRDLKPPRTVYEVQHAVPIYQWRPNNNSDSSAYTTAVYAAQRAHVLWRQTGL